MRAMQRDNDEKISSLGLVKYLDEYAETGVKWQVLKKLLSKII